MSDAEEYDVIVVGSGAGIVGAYAAADRGLTTLLMEKTEWIGGTTAYSGAGMWFPANPAVVRAGIPDSIDQARTYLDNVVGGDSPRELREAFLQTGPKLVEELEKNPTFGQFFATNVPDYFHLPEGSNHLGRCTFPPDYSRAELGPELEPLVRRPIWTERWSVEEPDKMVGGQALIGRALKAFVETGNGTVKTNTGLTGLIVEDGRVVGVEADSNGTPVTFRARLGVLLASGGFERNKELREKYNLVKTDEWTQGNPGNTGAALQAAMAIGAGTDLLDECWFCPGLVVHNSRPVFWSSVWGGIWVNNDGDRFCNERLPYDQAGHAILKNQKETGAAPGPVHWVFDQRQLDVGGMEGLPVAPAVPGWYDVEAELAAGNLVKADTLEELAEKIGVPAGNLTKTVEQFNEYARKGDDEQFHRGDAPWDKMIVYTVGPHQDGPNPVLGTIEQGPFYAAQIVVSDLGTKGGLTTDTDSRVLDTDGKVIPGLYASGNAMRPMAGRIYPGAGGPVGSSMVFSYRAALDMAGDRQPTARDGAAVAPASGDQSTYSRWVTDSN